MKPRCQTLNIEELAAPSHSDQTSRPASSPAPLPLVFPLEVKPSQELFDTSRTAILPGNNLAVSVVPELESSRYRSAGPHQLSYWMSEMSLAMEIASQKIFEMRNQEATASISEKARISHEIQHEDRALSQRLTDLFDQLAEGAAGNEDN